MATVEKSCGTCAYEDEHNGDHPCRKCLKGDPSEVKMWEPKHTVKVIIPAIAEMEDCINCIHAGKAISDDECWECIRGFSKFKRKE